MINEIQTETEQRAAVVAEARSWLGTKYHNLADVKGVGVDCGMLLVRVFVDTGLCAPFDPRPYPPDFFLHSSKEQYLGFVFDHAKEVTNPQPGDVAVFKVGRCYAHGGIITKSDPLTLVHAFADVHFVIEEMVAYNFRLSDPKRAVKFFSYWSKGQQL